MKKTIPNDINTKLIREYIKKNKLTVAEFCRRCSISQNIYYKLFSDTANFSVKSIFKIAFGMKVPIKDMFNKNR